MTINGATVLGNLDLFVAAGGGNKAYIREIILPPDQTGKYLIQFTTITDAATVSGIEIQQSVVPQGTSIHAGGAAAWQFVSDVGFSGGSRWPSVKSSPSS